MKALRNLMLVAVVVGMMGVRAFAGPIPSPLLDPKLHGPQMGESKIYNATGTAFLTVDWIVQWNSVLNLYEYLYQLEVSSFTGTVISRFTITPKGPVSFVGAIVDSLDDPSSYNHNLTGEDVDPLDLYTTAPHPSLTGITAAGDVAWGWLTGDEITVGKQSVILYLTSPMRPTYGYGEAKDSAPGPFATSYKGSQPIPVPSPEPGVLLMLGVSLVGISVWRRKA
jgi:hypothetical protein